MPTLTSDFRLNSTLLWRKGCLTGSSNRWTKTLLSSTPTANVPRCLLDLKTQVYLETLSLSFARPSSPFMYPCESVS